MNCNFGNQVLPLIVELAIFVSQNLGLSSRKRTATFVKSNLLMESSINPYHEEKFNFLLSIFSAPPKMAALKAIKMRRILVN